VSRVQLTGPRGGFDGCSRPLADMGLASNQPGNVVVYRC
jgi:hypothetical protein